MKSHFSKRGVLVSMLMIISVLTILTFSSCSKEEMDTVTKDSYYVKYLINGIRSADFSWNINTPNGQIYEYAYRISSWEETYGALNKGFKCSITTSSEANLKIYVSKNQEPFALKASGKTSTLSYVIDF